MNFAPAWVNWLLEVFGLVALLAILFSVIRGGVDWRRFLKLMGGHKTTQDKVDEVAGELDEAAKRDQELHAEMKELRAEVKGWRAFAQRAATSPPMLKGDFGLQDLKAAADSTETGSILSYALSPVKIPDIKKLFTAPVEPSVSCPKCGSTDVRISHMGRASESADTVEYECENGHRFKPPK